MWKILTAQIREEIYFSLTSRGSFPEEEKGCHKGSRGTGEQLNIDQHILNKRKTRQKNLAMAWIDDKKAYDIVPKSWIINCLKMYKISDEAINFIKKTMKTWRVELTARGKSFVETKIWRGIFLGDTLSPLLFIIAMIPLNYFLRKYTGRSRIARKYQPFNVHGRHQTVYQKRKRIGNPNIGSENIQSGHWDGIWHRKMRHASNEKRETTHYGQNGTTKSRQN